MAATDKDTIYVDIDDEITGIIDKVRSSDGKVVALVLPKRATVFQSIVNMKLLKRAADSSKKNLVLITSEAGLLPLAGVAGVHVAKTLNSKPEIPLAPDAAPEEEAIAETGEVLDPDPSKTVGELAGPPTDEVETVELDDDELPPEPTDKGNQPKTFEPPKNGKKNKKLKVPNFERFRLLIILGVVLLILGIGGLIFAAVALPKAKISIKTTATAVDVGLDLNLSTTATTLKPSNGTIPAKVAQQQKANTQQVPTTGQKNNGNKASGTIRLTNCSKQEGELTIPVGSSFSSGGNTFISQETVTLPESTFNGSGRCNSSPSDTVTLIAQSAGTSHNGATSFTAGSPYGGVTGTGTTSGGTDNIVQTVNQNDINNAKAKISSATADEVKAALKDQLKKEKYIAIDATFTAGTPTTTTSANVGDVATSVSVTENTTYTMFGVKEDDLKTLVEADIRQQIDEQQSILNNGISKAVYNVDSITATSAKLAMSTRATAGPDLDVETIKQQAAGKKPSEIREELGNNPDVTDVTVDLSPFWVGSVPKKTERITVIIADPADSNDSTSDGDNP